MRITFDSPNNGDIKIVTKFLWLPVIIGNEFRWMEKATIKYEYIGYFDSSEWDPIEFLNQ